MAQSSFFISKGGVVSIQDSGVFTLKNLSLVNDGTFQDDSGTVIFKEDSSVEPIEIRGKQQSNLNNVMLNLSHSDLTLKKNVSVNGSLSFRKGKIDLGGKTLFLGSESGQVLNEDNQNHISGLGKIRITQSLYSGYNHLGNLGLVIHASDSHGPITIVRKHEALLTPDGMSIARVFKINDANSSLKSSIFQLHFLDHELGNMNTQTLNMWQSQGQKWQKRIPLRVESDSNFVEFTLTGKGSFKQLTLAYPTQYRHAAGIGDSLMTISLFPNPVPIACWIDFGKKIEENIIITLLSMEGKIIQSHVIPSGSSQFKLSLLSQSSGFYMVRLQDEREIIFNQMILRN